MKKLLALLLCLAMVCGLVAGCSQNDAGTTDGTPAETTAQAGTPAETEAPEEDTIVIMVPPITGNYVSNLKTWAADFQEMYPHLTIEIIETSWGDHMSKLSTMAQAGEAPDITEVTSSAVATYVDMGVAIDISQYMDAERLADYDENAIAYMSLEGVPYGLPLYLTIQALGANKTLMEELGIDVAKIQQEGWSLDEFMDVIDTGTEGDRFGFVFANAGVCTSDLVKIYGAGFGLDNYFTEDLKYTYTADNMLLLLQSVEEMIAAGYMPNYGVEAGQRMVMCQTGNAMIFGKAMPLFESNFKTNNAALEANDGTAVENSLPMDYAFLPVPTMEGGTEACYGQVDGLIALRNNNTTDEHLKNVLLFMDYICSGDRIAACMNELYLDPVCQSGRDALTVEEGRDQANLDTTARLIALVNAPPAGVTAEMNATAETMMNEHIVPKVQSLLAGEMSAQEVYDYIVEAAHSEFGAENCVSGKI